MKDQTYIRIAEAVDRGVQRAPKAGDDISQAFIAYLKLVYTAGEAELVQYLNMPPEFRTADQVAEDSGLDADHVKNVLNRIAKKNALIHVGDVYCLPGIPMLLNYHHHSPEIRPNDLEAARLYQQFFIEEGYYKYYETSEKGTSITRAIPIEQSISAEDKIVSYEEAHELIKNLTTDELAFQPCPCRTRTDKMGIRECRDRFPIGSCILIGFGASNAVSLGFGKQITKDEAIKYLDEMQELGLVATTENHQSFDPIVICLCCGCCCSMVRGRTRWNNPDAVLPSNFVPQANDDCILCGTCLERCFFGALTQDEMSGRTVADPEKCVGCGVCTITCPQEALKLHRFERTLPFETSKDLWKTIALENKGA